MRKTDPKVIERLRTNTPSRLTFHYYTWAQDREGYRPDCVWLATALTVPLSTNDLITIPAGYVTDGASVPRWLQGIFPALGDHLLADVIHDYLYTNGTLSQAEADWEFYIWMQVLRPYRKSRLDNYLRYLAVRLLGRRNFKKYRPNQ